jgi:hypothetical protein
MTFIITALSIMTFGITSLILTLSLNDTYYNVMLSVIRLSVIRLTVIRLSVIRL